MLNVKGLWYLDLVKKLKQNCTSELLLFCEPPRLNSDWKLCWSEQQVKPWSSKNELTSQECRSPGRLKWLWTNHFQIFKGDHSLRDGFTRRNCCSWILSKFPPPPRQFVQLFFWRQNSRFESQFRTKNTIKAGGSTARAQNVDWMSGVEWMDTP